MQSSPSAPAVFYMQSEISKEQSCPFPAFSCSKTNISSAINNLKMFNVNQIIAVSDEVKQELRSKAKLVFKENEYEIFEINETGYVSVPEYWPVLMKSENSDLLSYYWFINDYKVPVAVTGKIKGEDKKYFSIAQDIDNLPEKKIDKKCSVQSELKEEEINFRTDCIGLPHIIKVSYFPNWKVAGAEKIYYVSPSFMLVFPEANNVTLHYGKTFADILGSILTVVGIVLIILMHQTKTKLSFLGSIIDFIIKRKALLILTIVIVLVSIGLFLLDFKKAAAGRDEFSMKIALSTKKYIQCENAGTLKDECYTGIAKLTKDWNLCAIKVSQKEKDRCFKEMGVLLKDRNMCETRVGDINLKEECRQGLK